jgi:hypothetical protein
MSLQPILPGIIKQFQYYKQLGDQTLLQLQPEELHWQPNSDSNSIAILIHHMSGNMLSRFTHFLLEDGEKSWRNRDMEFEPGHQPPGQLIEQWELGWRCLFDRLKNLNETDLDSIVYIRNMGHTALEAVFRQLAHYSYHVGQMVYVGKMLRGQHWKPLSIPKGESRLYNQKQFSQPKKRKHYTDDFLKNTE